MKFFLQCLVVLAIVTAGISPACAFVGGKTSWIEICGADGNVHKIEVSADLDPTAQDDSPVLHNDQQESCGFCLLHANGKLVKPEPVSIAKPLPPTYLAISAGTYVPVSLRLQTAQPRAPPALS